MGMSEADKQFPILDSDQTIPYFIAFAAYKKYVSIFGNIQTLERLGDRGGFSRAELDDLYPCWRDVWEGYLIGQKHPISK
jgi:hypothetical protein